MSAIEMMEEWVRCPERMGTAPRHVLQAVADLPLMSGSHGNAERAQQEERNDVIRRAREIVGRMETPLEICDKWAREPGRMRHASREQLEMVAGLRLPDYSAPASTQPRTNARNEVVARARGWLQSGSTIDVLRAWMTDPAGPEKAVRAAWTSQLDAVTDIPVEGLTPEERHVRAEAEVELRRRFLGRDARPGARALRDWPREELLNDLCSLSRLIVGCEGLADAARFSALCADVEGRPELAGVLARTEKARTDLIDLVNETRRAAFKARTETRAELLRRTSR